jgi:hypothetical protein
MTDICRKDITITAHGFYQFWILAAITQAITQSA